mmetsp:Transcript_44563/g.81374  ORF Transcript_44563/g.81374 Transcript_44563/m.81374 type:complete len:260 (+) Transcript_44563:74-853(+)
MPRLGTREQDSCGAAASLGKVEASTSSSVAHPTKRQFQAQHRSVHDGTSAQNALIGRTGYSSCSETPRKHGPWVSRQVEGYEVASTLVCTSRASEEMTPEKRRGFSHHLRSSGVEAAMHWKREAAGLHDAAAGVQQGCRGTRHRPSEMTAVFGGRQAKRNGTPRKSDLQQHKRSGSCPLSSYADTFGCPPGNRAAGPAHPAGRHIAEAAAKAPAESHSQWHTLQLVNFEEPILSRELCRFHDSPHRHGRSFAPPPRSPS